MPDLPRYLDDLEARIEPETEEALWRKWCEFLEGRFEGRCFDPRRRKASAPSVSWPEVSVNEGFDHYELMALQQFRGCSDALAAGNGQILNVRCNYGTCILPSLFGAEIYYMPDELDTLPTNRPLPDRDAVRKIVAAGPPDIESGWGTQVLEMGERFRAIAAEYPKIGRYVRIYHPDLQGPADVCELLFGSDLFLAIMEEPDLVHDALEVVTETYLLFMRAWAEVAPFQPDYNAHWGLLHRGNIVLRDDSAMNLSPDQCREYAHPYDQRLLSELGGGVIHFCGRGDHFIDGMAQLAGVTAFNLSQPEYNDMELIYTATVDRGLPLLGLSRAEAERAAGAGRDLRGLAHCA